MLEHYYEYEEKFLSPYAVKTKDTVGRKIFCVPCELRTEFQRDRDRILHSKAFRRLKHKTQVFLSPEGDHYRTRLTHTLEVSQIARTIARALRLNEDLVEAISLGHDLGHTPFGHMGEAVLNSLNPAGFAHNEHSLRVVDLLEHDGKGLNLTAEVRDGILNHKKSGTPSTLEGKVVSYADRIAYMNHDIEDAIVANLISEDSLPEEIKIHLGRSKSERISSLINDIVENSYLQPYVSLTSYGELLADRLRDFMFKEIYNSEAAKPEDAKAERMLVLLYRYYKDDPSKLPPFYRTLIPTWGVDNAVTDYLASMTDRFAIHKFEELFVPDCWNS